MQNRMERTNSIFIVSLFHCFIVSLFYSPVTASKYSKYSKYSNYPNYSNYSTVKVMNDR